MKKNMADHLRGEIKKLIEKQDYALQSKWKCYEEYQKLKAKGEQKDAQFYYKSYRTWSDEAQRCGEKSSVKLKAVQKYEQHRNMDELNMYELKIREKRQRQYMKYGPSDEEV